MSQHDYVAYVDEADGERGSQRRRDMLACTLAMVLSFGSHASMQALAPAESALEKLGVSPLGYAALTVSPIALGLVSPLFWGALFDHHKSMAYIIAPAGETLGAVLLAAGLCFHTREAYGLIDSGLMVLGFLIISACKAGVAIAEFSTIGHPCGRHSAIGFACVILVKHGMGMAMVWGVPQILAAAGGDGDEWRGITRVQLALLVPHVLSVCAGCALAWMHPCDNSSLSWQSSLHHVHEHSSPPSASPRCAVSPLVLPRALAPAPGSPAKGVLTRIASYVGLSSPTDGDADSSSSNDAVVMVLCIGLWRALAVGTMHAYHSIRVKFMQSRGLPLTAAGALFAAYDGIGIALVPAMAVLCRLVGLKSMLAIVPLVTSCATLVLAMNRVDDSLVRGALAVLSVMEVCVPIVPLAILPANTSQGLGAAFGVIEVMFITFQMAAVFVLGVARTESGYSGGFAVLVSGFLASLAVSLPIIIHGRDFKRWKASFHNTTKHMLWL